MSMVDPDTFDDQAKANRRPAPEPFTPEWHAMFRPVRSVFVNGERQVTSGEPAATADTSGVVVTKPTEAAAKVDDLAMLVRQLVHRLQKSNPDSGLAARAVDYLRRHGLRGSVAREASQSETASDVATAAIEELRGRWGEPDRVEVVAETHDVTRPGDVVRGVRGGRTTLSVSWPDPTPSEGGEVFGKAAFLARMAALYDQHGEPEESFGFGSLVVRWRPEET
jgi:hypothetical protein